MCLYFEQLKRHKQKTLTANLNYIILLIFLQLEMVLRATQLIFLRPKQEISSGGKYSLQIFIPRYTSEHLFCAHYPQNSKAHEFTHSATHQQHILILLTKAFIRKLSTVCCPTDFLIHAEMAVHSTLQHQHHHVTYRSNQHSANYEWQIFPVNHS